MISSNETPKSSAYSFARQYYNNEGKVFWVCVALGFLLALFTVLVFESMSTIRWRLLFITRPVLLSIGFAVLSIGLVRLMHALVGTKFEPMDIERIKHWNGFGIVEKFQVYFLIIVLLVLSTGMGWVIGGLASLFWRK